MYDIYVKTMKALIFKDIKGNKSFYTFSSDEKLNEIFNKICESSGKHFCDTKADYDQLKSEYINTDIIYKNFIGSGIYDHEGIFYLRLSEPEGEYWVEPHSEVAKNASVERIAIHEPILN